MCVYVCVCVCVYTRVSVSERESYAVTTPSEMTGKWERGIECKKLFFLTKKNSCQKNVHKCSWCVCVLICCLCVCVYGCDVCVRV